MCIAHWIFAINYFEVALNSKVFIKWQTIEDREANKKKQRNDFTIRAMNCGFYSVILISICIFAALESVKINHKDVKANFQDIQIGFFQFLSCIIVLVSLIMIRS